MIDIDSSGYLMRMVQERENHSQNLDHCVVRDRNGKGWEVQLAKWEGRLIHQVVEIKKCQRWEQEYDYETSMSQLCLKKAMEVVKGRNEKMEDKLNKINMIGDKNGIGGRI